jgi:WD40 repeat protein
MAQVQLLQDINVQNAMVVATGTNGFLNTSQLHSSAEEIQKHRVHQNNISALDTLRLSNLDIILTGGDDNALGITLRFSHDESTQSRFQTLLIPKAHTAAVTGLRTISHSSTTAEHSIIFVSAGNDQRVKVWLLRIPLSIPKLDAGMEYLQISRLRECWTCVADVSNVALLSVRKDEQSGIVREFEAVVVGVGMEVLRIVVDDVA